MKEELKDQMQEHEFRAILLQWADAGKFDDIECMVSVKASFELCSYAGDNYCAYCPSDGFYMWCGLHIKVIPDSRVSGLVLKSV